MVVPVLVLLCKHQRNLSEERGHVTHSRLTADSFSAAAHRDIGGNRGQWGIQRVGEVEHLVLRQLTVLP